MAFENIHPIERDIIFHEGFQSEFNTRRLGGVPVNIEYLKGGGVRLNGTSSEIIYPEMAINSDRSFRFIGILPSTIAYESIFNGISGDQDRWRINSSTIISYRTGGTNANRTLTTAIPQGERVEIILTSDFTTGSVLMYVNGVYNAFTAAMNNGNTDFIWSSVGHDYNGGLWFEGDIDLLQIWRKVLTAEEISNMCMV